MWDSWKHAPGKWDRLSKVELDMYTVKNGKKVTGSKPSRSLFQKPYMVFNGFQNVIFEWIIPLCKAQKVI